MRPSERENGGRDQQTILEDLLRRLPGYTPELSEDSTVARALMQVFARYMELLSASLARVPERSLLAFLDMLGTELLPAQAARAPIVFGLSEGSPVDVTLPARSQVAAASPVAAPSLSGTQPKPPPAAPIVFATEQSITLCRSKLVAVYSVDPGSDSFADHSARLTTGFELFEDTRPCEHAIYLGHDQLFALAGEIKLILSFTLTTGAGRALALQWDYLTENGWLPFANPPEDDTTGGLRNDGQLKLFRSCGPDAKKETFAGRTSFWLRGRLTTRLVPEGGNGLLVKPELNDIRARVEFGKDDLLPEAAFNGSSVLDVSKDFFPFGEQPAPYGVFYLASKEVFQRKGARVTLDLGLRQPGVGRDGLAVTWEYSTGGGWAEVGVDKVFNESVKFSFLCPRDWAEVTVNGVGNYWLRVRITAGNYGLPLRASPVPTRLVTKVLDQTITVDDSGGYSAGQSVVLAKGADHAVVVIQSVPPGTRDLVVTGSIPPPPVDFIGGTVSAADGPLLAATLRPPIIRRLGLGYSYVTDPEPLDHCLAYNDFLFEDQSEACRWPDLSFTPFRAVSDRAPTVHFGFDRQLPAGLVSTFLDIAGGDGGDASSPFVWEYRSLRGWNELAVLDQTAGFARSGMVQWIGPPDAVATDGLGGALHRIRARVRRGQRPATAPVQGLWLNAVWAAQGDSFEREALGTSDGNPRQTFSARRAPVLVGEAVWVEEWTGRGEYWRTFVQHVDERDLRFDRDAANNEVTAVWVAWRSRPHLHDSGPSDRHYTIERARGLVRFGDGERGMIPPAGRRSTISYTTGGGPAGNVGIGALAQVRTAVPFIASTSNPVAASGGATTETVPAVKLRGPQRLRHRDRAVAAVDYEWLAREASPEVARARCLPITGAAGRGQRGWVTVLIVPCGADGDGRPTPSPELRRRVHEHLAARAPAAVVRRLRVQGPSYVPVTVAAELVPLPAQSIGLLEARLRSRLDAFFHPLRGGVARQGWDFGQTVHLSQVASVLEAVEGVDFARAIHLEVDGRLFDESVPVGPDMLVSAGTHELKLILAGA